MRDHRHGFTLIDLTVATAIMALLFTAVLASYRHGQRSSQLDSALKQTQQIFDRARTHAIGGQIYQGSYPAGGYGIHIALSGSDNFIPFVVPVASGSFADAIILNNQKLSLNNVQLVALCGYTQVTLSGLPCSSGWQTATSSIDVIFSGPGFQNSQPAFTYVGGILEHPATGKRAYFYVSLFSGIVSGGNL